MHATKSSLPVFTAHQRRPFRRRVSGAILAVAVMASGLFWPPVFVGAIVGGATIPPDQLAAGGAFEWLVRLEGPDGTCSGSLIAADWVLTAGHCQTARVAFVGDDQVGQLLVESVPHPSLDVALLRLATPSAIRPVSRSATSLAISAGQTAITLAGWGVQSQSGPSASQPLAGTATTQFVNNSVIQTGSAAVGCEGDSGGAMLFRGTLAGVISSAEAQCGSFTTGIRFKTIAAWVTEVAGPGSVNRAPVVLSGELSVVVGSAFEIPFEFSDPEGAALSFEDIVSLDLGPLLFQSCDAEAPPTACHFTAPEDFLGDTVATYTVSDGQRTAAGTWIVHIQNDLNPAPPVASDSLNRAWSGFARDLVLQAFDPNGDALSYEVVTPPAHGSISCVGRACVYTSQPGFVGEDAFAWRANDGTFIPDPATATLQVRRGPASGSDFAVGQTPLRISLDLGEGGFFAGITVPPLHGALECEEPPSLNPGCTYVAALGFFGLDSFEWRAADTEGVSAVSTFTINVVPHLPPFAVDQRVAIAPGAARSFSLLGGDPEEAPTTQFVILTLPQHGDLTCAGRACEYTPAAAFVGLDSFTWRVSDGEFLSPVATVTFDVYVPGIGDLDPAFAPEPNGGVQSMAVQADHKVLIAGSFNAIGDTPRQGLARLNPDGTLDPSFDLQVEGGISSIVVQADGKILLGGLFNVVDGETRNNIARVNPDGSLDPTFNPDVDNGVQAMAIQADGKILLGGFFTAVGGVARNSLVRLNPDGSLESEFAPDVDGGVFTLALQGDGRILAGGGFGVVSGEVRHGLARLQQDGAVDTSFHPDLEGLDPDSPATVTSVAVQADQRLLVAGYFALVEGAPRGGFARLSRDGTLDRSFDAPLDGSIMSVSAAADGKVVVGGSFTSTGGVALDNIARLNPDGTLDAPFNPHTDGPVYTMAIEANGSVLLGGFFQNVGERSGPFIARVKNDRATESLTVSGSNRVEWLRNGSAPESQAVTFELSVDGGQVYAPLGPGTRITGGWEIASLNLPRTGHVRARARVVGGLYNGSSGLVEALTAFGVQDTPCAPGTWSSSGSGSPVPCEPSPAGHFVDTVGATSASPCPAGSFQPLAGQTACIPASPGFFVPDSGATGQTACAPGFTSGAGATACDPASTLSINDVTVTEGNVGARIMTFTVTRSGAPSAVSFRWATTNGTAAAAVDYIAAGGVGTIAAAGNGKALIAVTLKGDRLDEYDETLVVNLVSATGAVIADGQGVGTILDNDAEPLVSFRPPMASRHTVPEAVGVASMPLVLSAPSGKVVSIVVRTAGAAVDHPAVAGRDYTVSGPTPLTFEPGEVSKTFNVPILDDSLDEENESFGVEVLETQNVRVAADPLIVRIADDDPAPFLSISDVTVLEGAAGSTDARFAVSLSQASGKTITVSYRTADGTARAGSDYVPIPPTLLTFAPGGPLTRTVSVAINGDPLSEPDEAFRVLLSAASNARLSKGTGRGTIEDDDPLPKLSIDSVAVKEGDLGSTRAVFTVTLDAPSGRTVTVKVKTVAGTASAADFTSPGATTLAFPPGTTSRTYAVSVTGDRLDEPDEKFVVDLFNPTGATLSGARATGTILDDDIRHAHRH